MISITEIGDHIDQDELRKRLAQGEDLSPEMQIYLLRNALLTALEEFGRIEETLSVTGKGHRASPDQDTMRALFTSLYYAAPPEEREDVWTTFAGPGAGPMAELDEEV